MALTITDDEMVSDITRHRAHRDEGGRWYVTWCPQMDPPLDRNAAITAMLLAEHVAQGADETDPLIRDWAAELGMTAAERLVRSMATED